MVFTAADASQRVILLTEIPDDLKAITATEWNAGLAIHDDILKEDFGAGAQASPTHNDTPLGSSGQWQNRSGKSATASVTVLRDLDDTGRPDPEATSEIVFAALKTPDVPLVLGVRQGPDPDEEIADSDEMRWVGIVAPDVPQPPTDSNAGFYKVVIPLLVRDFETFTTVPTSGG